MKQIKKILFFLFLLTFSSAFTQNISVKGKVIDNDNQETMPGATVMLLNPLDSSFYKFGVTNPSGDFTIKGAEIGKYILQISFIGYQSYYKEVLLKKEESTLNLGNIKLNTKKELLESVEIVAEKIPVIINGDTVEFNANAFKTQPEANVADLLKKLPGVEVEKDGTVKAQGEEVKKVLIDGKEFFGDDTKLATENLPADMVQNVQIYDDFSDASKITGIDDGDRTKTINLKIKKDRKKGLFGNVTLGGGMTAIGTGDISTEEGLHDNKLNINKFKDNMQLSTLGMLNNVNQQGFSYRDYINFSGGVSNMGGFRNSGNGGVPLSNNPNDGFTTTKAGGINWNKNLSPTINFSSSYFYNEANKQIYGETNRQYITDSTDFNSLEKENQHEFNRNHRIKFKYEQKIDTTQDLKITSDFSYSEGNLYSYSTSSSIDIAGNFLNSSNNNNQSTGNDIAINGKLTYGKRFNKRGRSFVSNIKLGNSENEKKYYVESQNSFTDGFGGTSSSSIKQLQNASNNQLNYSGKVSFTEPLGKRKYLELGVERSNYNNEYVKEFYDILGPNLESFNSNLSLAYNNSFVYHSYKFNTKFNTDKSNLTIGSTAQKSNLNGEIISNNFQVNRGQWNILPNIKWNYSFNKSSRFRFNYKTNAQEPSLEQLQPTIDNSNPLVLYQGNPNLNSEYRHNASMRIMSFNQYSFTNIYITINGTYTKNKITEAQSINSQFVQIITPINVPNDYLLSGYFYYGTPIRPIKSKINLSLNSSYNRSKLFVNLDENDVTRINNGVNFSIENRKKEIVDIRIGTNVNLNTTSYSLSSNLDQGYISTGYFSEFLVEFFKTWTFNTAIEFTLYSGDQFTDNPTIPLWKAYLSKRFLKGKSGMLKLAIYDILNQNIGIKRNSELNYIEDERITTLSRYVMLSFTYKINRFGGKPKKKTSSSSDSK